jgi:hypothetical protein
MSADSAETGAIIGATGTLLSTASSLGMKWNGVSGGGGGSATGGAAAVADGLG